MKATSELLLFLLGCVAVAWSLQDPDAHAAVWANAAYVPLHLRVSAPLVVLAVVLLNDAMKFYLLKVNSRYDTTLAKGAVLLGPWRVVSGVPTWWVGRIALPVVWAKAMPDNLLWLGVVWLVGVSVAITIKPKRYLENEQGKLSYLAVAADYVSTCGVLLLAVYMPLHFSLLVVAFVSLAGWAHYVHWLGRWYNYEEKGETTA